MVNIRRFKARAVDADDNPEPVSIETITELMADVDVKPFTDDELSDIVYDRDVNRSTAIQRLKEIEINASNTIDDILEKRGLDYYQINNYMFKGRNLCIWFNHHEVRQETEMICMDESDNCDIYLEHKEDSNPNIFELIFPRDEIEEKNILQMMYFLKFQFRQNYVYDISADTIVRDNKVVFNKEEYWLYKEKEDDELPECMCCFEHGSGYPRSHLYTKCCKNFICLLCSAQLTKNSCPTCRAEF